LDEFFKQTKVEWEELNEEAEGEEGGEILDILTNLKDMKISDLLSIDVT
jgi:hypothetical protein